MWSLLDSASLKKKERNAFEWIFFVLFPLIFAFLQMILNQMYVILNHGVFGCLKEEEMLGLTSRSEKILMTDSLVLKVLKNVRTFFPPNICLSPLKLIFFNEIPSLYKRTL